MKIEKAIEIQEEILKRGSMINDEEDDCAIKLGIEASKRERDYRKGYMSKWHPLLPGETGD